VSIIIRHMTDKDRGDVTTMIRRILGRHVERPSAPWEPSLLAIRDGKIVGHVSMVIRNSGNGNCPEIRNFVVDESARHTRVPLLLFTAIEREVAKAGFLTYRGVLDKTNPYFKRIADRWGGKLVHETDIDWIMEGNLLTTKGSRYSNVNDVKVPAQVS